MTDKFQSLEKNIIKQMRQNTDELQKARDNLHTTSLEIKSEISSMLSTYDKKLEEQKSITNLLTGELADEKHKRAALEATVKKRNIRFVNIPETIVPSDLVPYIIQTLNKVDIVVTERDIETCYRLGPKKIGSTRTTLVIFSHLKLKQEVKLKATSLRSLGLSITDDLPYEWVSARKKLRQYFWQAKKLVIQGKQNWKVRFWEDKLQIDGTLLDTADACKSFSDDLSPEKAFTPMNDNTTLFFTSNSPLSNHYPSVFKHQNVIYNCAEQFIMAQKATLFHDELTLNAIMQESDPKRQKAIGKSVKNFKRDHWESNAKNLCTPGILAKFSQNEYIKTFLLQTGKRRIGEANPNDSFFGVGLGLNNPRAWNTTEWAKSSNIMGQILEETRAKLSKN